MIAGVIVKRIFEYFGIPNRYVGFTMQEQPYMLKKEISIELEDGEVLQKNIWGIEGKISNSIIRALLADITVSSDFKEYILVFQLDNLTVYALKLEEGKEAVNRAFFAINGENKSWVELSNLLLAKLLVGVEQLNELFINYQPITNYQELYQYLINFLNYEETIQNNK